MAKVAMQKLRICAMRSDRKAILEKLQRMEDVQVEPVALEDEVFSSVDTSQQQERFTGAIAAINSALAILDEYEPEKTGLLDSYKPRPEISREDYEYIIESDDRNLSRCREVIANKRRIDELRAEITRIRLRIDALSPWLDGDVPMRFDGTASTAMFTGYFPENMTNGDILEKLAQTDPELEAVHFDIIGQSAEMTCVYAFCLKSEKERFESALRTMGFTRPAEISKSAPAKCAAELESRIEQREEQINELEGKIRHRALRRQKFRYLLDRYEMRLEKYKAIEKLGSSKNTFILEGWAIKSRYDHVAAEIEKLGAYCEKIEPQKNESAPVSLKNNGFTEGGAPILKMYSLPSKSDIDPTSVMSFFYYLLFGIMLGDAAYGIIMALATGFVMLKFKPEAEKRRTMKLFFYSGISSIFWGVLFGSYFGDLPNVIARTFFGATENVVKPIWFDPISDPMTMLYLSIGLGAVHVLMGLVMGIIASFKNKDAAAAIFDYLSWLTLIISIVGWALLSLIELPFAVPAILPKIFIGLIILSVAVILFMNGRSSKNFIVRIMKGAYALYGITSYLSDFMSYSRILALGLATGVISQVFNQMGSMAGGSGSVFGIIFMILICLVGHAFNIGISLIGCYVHTCRLQYVEFFGKFYEGGGEDFTPLASNTKHFKFKEEN
ncbi:MAG: V-type ATP synthase subunit I [Clostridia bacterium]|nr:V-type ATP synthase subunit I [Clostridia bacterium]